MDGQSGSGQAWIKPDPKHQAQLEYWSAFDEAPQARPIATAA